MNSRLLTASSEHYSPNRWSAKFCTLCWGHLHKREILRSHPNPTQFMGLLLKKTGLCCPCPPGGLQGVSLLPVLAFCADPYQLLSRKSFTCDKSDVMWAEIQETDYSWGQQDRRKQLSNAFDSWEWIPACTGRRVRLTPLHFMAPAMGISPPHPACFRKTGRKLLSSRFSPLSNVTDVSQEIKKKKKEVVLRLIDPHTHKRGGSWKPASQVP